MKLLIAEDDTLIREGLYDILSAEGFDCLQAENGQEAVDLYLSERPDVVLLDIMMPDKDGYSVCREIRKHDQYTAIIFISAKSEEIDRVLGLELGADDYIVKPFGKHEVLARLRSVIRRYRLATKSDKTGDANVFQLGDLTVDPNQLRASRGEQPIDLSLRDLKTLQLFYQNPNRVISREELFDHCWGRDYLPSSRTLDQHISTLRKRIERDSREPKIIQTVHGVGYRFEA